MKPAPRRSARTSLEILEEAIHLLRSAPGGAIAANLAGSVPFFLALLYFATDMSRNAYAREHLLSYSLVLAALFVWKNAWQAVFTARLFQLLSPSEPLRRPVRMIAIQCALQPLALLAIPASLLALLPFAPVIMFFRNLALYSALGRADAVEAARKQAGIAPGQSWGVLGLITMGGLLLYVNVLIVVVAMPQLGRTLLGIEGDMARMGLSILNNTTMGVALALAWMALDPLIDAVAALRCFYGESLATGEDLGASLRRWTQIAAPVLVVLVALIVWTPAAPAQQADAPGASVDTTSVDTIDHQRLEKTMAEVIRRREFTWRDRRSGDRVDAPDWLTKLLEQVEKARLWLKEKIWDPLFKTEKKKPGSGAPGDSPLTARMMKWLLAIAGAVVAAVLLYLWKARRAPVVAAVAVTAAAPQVDLTDESLSADQLPESSWMQLADEWLAKGDFRLALRALYLASLNSLSQRNLVTVRRWKSGRDYRREVERRGRALPAIAPVFAQNVALFELGWYSRHEVDRAMVDRFVQRLEEIKKTGDRSQETA
jgi:hypothetical protein